LTVTFYTVPQLRRQYTEDHLVKLMCKYKWYCKGMSMCIPWKHMGKWRYSVTHS